VEFKNIDMLVTYHGQEKPFLQQVLRETHIVHVKNLMRAKMEIFTLKSKDLE
jgi:hypothetical protein